MIFNKKMSEDLFSKKNWNPNKIITKYIEKQFTYIENKESHILEISQISDFNNNMFSFVSEKIQWEYLTKHILTKNDKYDFVYMRHSLEKNQDPRLVLEYLKEYCSMGYIETPSPLVEFSRRIQDEKFQYRGHVLSLYIIWVDPKTNILNVLPKYPLIEHLIVDDKTENNIRDILQQYPHYWNTYFIWNKQNPIKYKIYEHGINFDIKNDYHNLIKKAIEESVQSANIFLSHINKNINIFKDTIDDIISESTEA